MDQIFLVPGLDVVFFGIPPGAIIDSETGEVVIDSETGEVVVDSEG